MKKNILLLLFLLFIAPALYAEPIAKLAKEAFSVRNADPEVKDFKRWLKLKKDLQRWIIANKVSGEMPRALFLSATIDRGLAVKTDDLDYAISSLRSLQKIEKEYKQSADLGFALLEKAELFALLGAFDEAKLNYKKVVDGRFDDTIQIRAERGYENPKDVDLNQAAYIKRITSAVGRRKGGKIVVIDPGHGGEDSGAIGFNRMAEKNYVLDVAKRVQEYLEEQDITAILTRDEDRFVPLATRTSIANRVKADLFISLHANASEKHDLFGLETYYLDNSGDASSQLLAERENGIESASDDLSFILSDLVQTGKLTDSVAVAHTLEGAILKTLSGTWPKVKSLGVKKAPFYVLVGAHMPCVLVEMFFIDNKVDGQMIADKKFRSNLALGVGKGISQGIGR